MKYYIGIDLGGTNIKAGVVSEDFTIISKATRKTNLPRPAEDICRDMAEAAMDAIGHAGLTLNDIESVGIGTPGTANSQTGIIEYSNNLGFLNVPIVSLMRSFISRPCFVENDANAAAYGEFVAGAARGANDAVCITLGTGVGGGIIINKKIYSGFNFAGAEIGHTVIDPNGPKCTCGRNGCFEVFSSATGLVRMTKEAMEYNPDSLLWAASKQEEKVTARTAFNAMRMGDQTAKAVVDKYIRYLACGITNTINIFQPDILCIGGGVCNEGDPLLVPLKELVAQEIYSKHSAKNTEIVIAQLGNDAGIIGAAFLGLEKQS
ncbi:MAG: ROK family protein [Oscillospiraceae bacterium]